MKQTNRKRRSHWGMCLFVALVGAVWTIPAAHGEISQQEVDHIVDSEILMCEHDEDAENIEADLKGRGATEDMLAQGYSSAIRKTLNAPSGSLESEKFHSAVFGFAKVAKSSVLTNLLQVATSSTNDLNASEAILAYQGRDPSSRALMQWCMKEASRTNCQKRVHAAIWECLGKGMRMTELPKDVKEDILSVARMGVLGNPMTAFEADHILVEHDPLYVTSLLRKRAISRIGSLGKGETSKVVKQYFERLKIEAEK